MNVEALSRLIGKRATKAYFPLLQTISARAASYRYSFMSEEDFTSLAADRSRLAEANQVYWNEILFRAHAAATTAIIRNSRWIDAAAVSHEAGNLFGLAACIRSFIEAAGDTNDALGQIPLTMADYAADISEAVAGRLSRVSDAGDIEEKLIHFLVARKLPRKTDLPEAHRAKESRTYVREFNWFGIPEVEALYVELCDLVHPAGASVYVYFHDGASDSTWQVSADGEIHQLESLSERLPPLLERVCMLAFTLPLLTLAVLNFLPLRSVHTPEMRDVQLDSVPLWGKIRRSLSRAGISTDTAH